MNKFELYCMIFFVLDAAWDENHNPTLGEFLSGANPFLFTDIGSADPRVYNHFCEVIPNEITVENSYGIASKSHCQSFCRFQYTHLDVKNKKYNLLLLELDVVYLWHIIIPLGQ